MEEGGLRLYEEEGEQVEVNGGGRWEQEGESRGWEKEGEKGGR